MKRLYSFLTLCLACTIFLSCLNADNKKDSSEDANRITSDELMYEIMAADAQLATNHSTPDPFENRQGARLNNSTLQEMFVVYTHLIMSENQIILFEDQFNTTVKESNQKILSQIEIQEIMDFSFETVLDKEQFNKYNEWRIAGTQ